MDNCQCACSSLSALDFLPEDLSMREAEGAASWTSCSSRTLLVFSSSVRNHGNLTFMGACIDERYPRYAQIGQLHQLESSVNFPTAGEVLLATPISCRSTWVAPGISVRKYNCYLTSGDGVL